MRMLELKSRIDRDEYVVDARAIAEVIVERVLAGQRAAVERARELTPPSLQRVPKAP